MEGNHIDRHDIQRTDNVRRKPRHAMRVNFRGLERRVAQELLELVQIPARLQKRRGKRMAQRVDGHALATHRPNRRAHPM